MTGRSAPPPTETVPLVPHGGAMRLLDRVLSHDADSIVCAATSHRDPANPLRRDGMLPCVCGVEYALQAVAAHGALTGGGTEAGGTGGVAQPPGYLASLRGVSLRIARLDEVAEELRVEARALSRAARGFVYAFSVLAGEALLLSGQAAIIIPPSSDTGSGTDADTGSGTGPRSGIPGGAAP